MLNLIFFVTGNAKELCVPSRWRGSCLGKEEESYAACIGVHNEKYLVATLLQSSTPCPVTVGLCEPRTWLSIDIRGQPE